jgi:hypothetical protein
VFPQGVHCTMCTCKMAVERISIEAFFYHIGRRGVNWGLSYRHLLLWRKGCVCTLSHKSSCLSKMNSWWPRVSQLFLCIHVNEFMWTYVHKQSLSSLNISNTTPKRHQMPYMSIVNRSTLIMKLNLENSAGHQRALCNAPAIGGR